MRIEYRDPQPTSVPRRPFFEKMIAEGHLIVVDVALPPAAALTYADGVADERRAARLLVAAVLAYDEALRSCGNDPSRMASFCSVQGHTLDALYDRMTSVARTMERRSPTPGVSPTVIDVSDGLLE